MYPLTCSPLEAWPDRALGLVPAPGGTIRGLLVLTEGCLKSKIHFCLCVVSSAQMAYLDSLSCPAFWFLSVSSFMTAYLFCDFVSCFFSGMCTFLDLLSGAQQTFAGITILSQLTFPVLSHELYSPVRLDSFPFSVLPSIFPPSRLALHHFLCPSYPRPSLSQSLEILSSL